jgi:hypothetical protein
MFLAGCIFDDLGNAELAAVGIEVRGAGLVCL